MTKRLTLLGIGFTFVACGSTPPPPPPPEDPTDFVLGIRESPACALNCDPTCTEASAPWVCPAWAAGQRPDGASALSFAVISTEIASRASATSRASADALMTPFANPSSRPALTSLSASPSTFVALAPAI